MSSLVSVIIPVYNIENYIGNCLTSILSQTYKNIEIIITDDGSTDSSAEKIRVFDDSRIKYFRQENSGVSAARNKGLDEASGEYIFFVDGDDFIHPKTIELSVECAKKTSADMVCSRYLITDSSCVCFDSIDSYSFFDADFDTLFKKDGMLGKSSVAKLIRKTVTEKIRFQEGIAIGEDGCYIIKLMNEGIKAVILDKQLYFYLKRDGSATTSALDEKRLTILYAYDDMCEYLKNSENAHIRAYCLRSVFYNINTRRTLYKNSPLEKLVNDECKRIGKKNLSAFLHEKNIPVTVRLLHSLFFRFPFLYTVASRFK